MCFVSLVATRWRQQSTAQHGRLQEIRCDPTRFVPVRFVVGKYLQPVIIHSSSSSTDSLITLRARSLAQLNPLPSLSSTYPKMKMFALAAATAVLFAAVAGKRVFARAGVST